MAHKPVFDQELLRRFLNNQCTPQEEKIVLEWLANPENKDLAQRMMENHWKTIQRLEDSHEPDIENLLSKTRQRIVTSEVKTGGVYRYRSSWWHLAAACIGIIMISCIAVFFYNYKDSIQMLSKHEAQKDPDQEIRSTPGQIIEKILSDGTKVILNAQSSLLYPDNFSGYSTREVILNGEAFFDVAEDKDHPFIVRTKSVNIVVHGTAFNLKSYDGDPTTETTLIRGKVVVENLVQPSQKVALKPNQKAVFSQATERITLFDVKIQEPISWDENRLAFDDEAFHSVIKSLERWYGVTIHIDDESNINCRLTARVDKESLVQTLEVLKSLTGIQYSIIDKDVYIKGKICEP